MTGIIVTGHGNFASGILSTMKLIAGAQEEVIGVDFLEEYSVEELKEYLQKAIASLENEILIFTDLQGGSPFNKSVELKVECKEKKIEVLAGTNFPMLLTAAMSRNVLPFSEVVEEVLSAGRESITKFVLAAPKQMETDEDDGI